MAWQSTSYSWLCSLLIIGLATVTATLGYSSWFVGGLYVVFVSNLLALVASSARVADVILSDLKYPELVPFLAIDLGTHKA